MPKDDAGISLQLHSLSNWEAGAKAPGKSIPDILQPLGTLDPWHPWVCLLRVLRERKDLVGEGKSKYLFFFFFFFSS